MSIDIEQVRQEQAAAKRRTDKQGERSVLDAALSKVEDFERARRAAVGRLEAAQAAVRAAQGDVTAAESNLARVIAALEAEMAKV